MHRPSPLAVANALWLTTSFTVGRLRAMASSRGNLFDSLNEYMRGPQGRAGRRSGARGETARGVVEPTARAVVVVEPTARAVVVEPTARAVVVVEEPAAGAAEVVLEPAAGAAEVAEPIPFGGRGRGGRGRVGRSRGREGRGQGESIGAVGQAAPGGLTDFKRRRNSYDANARAALGQQAAAFHRDWMADHGNARGVWQAFQTQLAEESAVVGGDRAPSVQEIRQAYRVEAKRGPGLLGALRKRGRRRLGRPGRLGLAPELGAELWHWFVDRVNSCQMRINSNMLLAQAETLRRDLLELHHHRVESGEIDACMRPHLPKLDRMWLTRWRRKYGVAFRAVNLRYKVSAAKRDARIRILWCNVIRLRALHEALFGEGKLRFVGLDQKPLWFNSSHDSKTLAVKGTRRVAVKENTAAARERFTVLTNCLSWTPTVSKWPPAATGDAGPADAGAEQPGRVGLQPPAGAGEGAAAPAVAEAAGTAPGGLARAGPGHRGAAPSIAVLFRAGSSGTGATMRKRLTVPDDTLLQFAPKGSYRLTNMLEYFQWAFRPAPHPSQTLVFVLDWYAVHLDEQIDEMLHKMGHAVLRIGGGITGDVQVGDTHRHGPYTKVYRDLEQEDAQRSLSLRRGRMPETSRQTVLQRAAWAWRQLDHSGGRAEWIQDGFLNALDGSDDGALRRDLQPIWARLGMSDLRAQIVREVQDMVRSGRLTEWSQYPTILEAYDDHRGLREGEEAAVPEVVEDDADCKSDAEAPEAIEDEAAQADDSGAAGEGAARAHVAALATTGLLASDLEARARTDLARVAQGNRLAALSDAVARLRGHDDSMAERLQNRIENIQREVRLTTEAQVWLRARALLRTDDETAARAAAEAEDAERDRKMLELKRARTEEATARAQASASRDAARVSVAKARAEVSRARQEAERTKQRNELLRAHFVDWKLGEAKSFFQHAKQGERRREECASILRRSRDNLGKIPPAPSPWSPKDRDGYIEVTPGLLMGFGPTKRGHLECASQALAHRLYGNRHPSEARTAKSPVERAKDMLAQCLPGFSLHFPYYMLISQTLRQHQGNLDLALFEVLWRFSHIVGQAWPQGLLQWPMSPPDINAFVRAQGREDLLVACHTPTTATAAGVVRGDDEHSSPAAAAVAAFVAAMASSSGASSSGAPPAAAKARPPKANAGPAPKTGMMAKWAEGAP